MRRGRASGIAVAVMVVTACLAGGVAANALWSWGRSLEMPGIQTGQVQFAATPSGGDESMSAGGRPVSIRIPGEVIQRVGSQTAPDPEPVIWRFSVTGAASGITGIEYDVAIVQQIWRDGSRKHSLASGTAATGTLLAHSTLRVYPAAVNGDCSTVPDPTDTSPSRSVSVVDGQDVILQKPNQNQDGALITSDWCGAVLWKGSPDGAYLSSTSVTARSADGDENSALAEWSASVGVPPSLDSIGTYQSTADVAASDDGGDAADDEDHWSARVFPDPDDEPDVEITIDPTVTNINPSVPAGDHADVKHH